MEDAAADCMEGVFMGVDLSDDALLHVATMPCHPTSITLSRSWGCTPRPQRKSCARCNLCIFTIFHLPFPKLFILCIEASLGVGLYGVCCKADMKHVSICLCNWRWGQMKEVALAT